MAKNRMVNTRFWQDTYISNLDPVEKLLFLYLLTNNWSTLSGIYEVPLKIIAVETGIDKEMVQKVFKRFEKDKKAMYRDGWVVVKNFIKHHEQGSPKIKIGIEKDLENTPNWARNYVFSGKGMDTLSKGMDTLSPSASASASAFAPTVALGQFQNVHLTETEHANLVEQLNENAVATLVEELSGYIESTGKKYRSHYATIQNWARRRIREHGEQARRGNKPKREII